MRSRSGFALFELLVLLALLGFLIGLLLPVLVLFQNANDRTRSINNLKQLAIGAHSYHNNKRALPPGVDKNGFSAHAHLLPYIEQEALLKKLDLTVAVTDPANAQARQTRVSVFLSPLDALATDAKHPAACSYPFSAGSKFSLANNNGVCYLDSKTGLFAIADGTSNTLLLGETLVGDFGTDAKSVQRQHVKLAREALANLKSDSGKDDWTNSKNIAGERGAAWIDGSFLQGTFTGTRVGNDSAPDVNCSGAGGLSALRSGGAQVLVGFCDASVRSLRANLSLQTWQQLTDRADNNVPNID